MYSCTPRVLMPALPPPVASASASTAIAIVMMLPLPLSSYHPPLVLLPISFARVTVFYTYIIPGLVYRLLDSCQRVSCRIQSLGACTGRSVCTTEDWPWLNADLYSWNAGLGPGVTRSRLGLRMPVELLSTPGYLALELEKPLIKCTPSLALAG